MDIISDKDIKAVAKCVESTDKDQRGNAVICLAEMYKIIG